MKVFVSHGTRDTWIARQMARCIGDVGSEAFIDAYDLAVGDRFEDAIVEAIRQADALLALLTPLSARRAWLHHELGIARAFGKRIGGVLYGMTLDDLETDAQSGAGMLRFRTVIELNDFDRYLENLGKG